MSGSFQWGTGHTQILVQSALCSVVHIVLLDWAVKRGRGQRCRCFTRPCGWENKTCFMAMISPPGLWRLYRNKDIPLAISSNKHEYKLLTDPYPISACFFSMSWMLFVTDFDNGRSQQDWKNQQTVDRTPTGGIHRRWQLWHPVSHGSGCEDESCNDRRMFSNCKCSIKTFHLYIYILIAVNQPKMWWWTVMSRSCKGCSLGILTL